MTKRLTEHGYTYDTARQLTIDLPRKELTSLLHGVSHGLAMAQYSTTPRPAITTSTPAINAVLECLIQPAETLLHSHEEAHGRIHKYPIVKRILSDGLDMMSDRFFSMEETLDILVVETFAPTQDMERYGEHLSYSNAVTAVFVWAYERNELQDMMYRLRSNVYDMFPSIANGTATHAYWDLVRCQRWLQMVVTLAVYDAANSLDYDDTPWAWVEPLFAEQLYATLEQPGWMWRDLLDIATVEVSLEEEYERDTEFDNLMYSINNTIQRAKNSHAALERWDFAPNCTEGKHHDRL